MVRRAERVDDNQPEIVAMFRKLGASVKHTHMVKGFVDIVVGFHGSNVLVEIKDSKKPPSARKLTPAEAKFHAEWRGAIVIIDHPGQCVGLLEDMANKVYPIEQKPTMGRPKHDK